MKNEKWERDSNFLCYITLFFLSFFIKYNKKFLKIYIYYKKGSKDNINKQIIQFYIALFLLQDSSF